MFPAIAECRNGLENCNPHKGLQFFLDKKSEIIYIEYVEKKNYGHQDIFMGKRSHIDVFPGIVKFINQHKI